MTCIEEWGLACEAGLDAKAFSGKWRPGRAVRFTYNKKGMSQ